MELYRVACTTCGNSLEVETEDTTILCDACGNTFLVTNGKDFASKSDKEISNIKKLRSNLQKSVLSDDHKNILHFSKEILSLIPKDYLGNYFYAYANYSFGSRRYLFDFYEQVINDLPEETDNIIDHMTDYSDVRDRSLVEKFITNNDLSKLDKYKDVYRQKLVDEENYSAIPRDIFISFRSTELVSANEVLNILEEDSNTCWISTRNLRPNDNDNYWSNIEDAIKKSRLFLVVSSHDAMISRDVKKEIEIATRLKKRRIEYKIDKSKHTSVFKYFFDGDKWVDATEDKEQALKTLKKRVYEILNSEIKKENNKRSRKQASETDEYTKKMNRSRVELLNSNFEDASNTIKDALGVSPDSSEAWWLLFLSKNNITSTEDFYKKIKGLSSLSQLISYYEQVPYKQYKRYAEFKDNEYPENIEKYEKLIYDDLLKYINVKATLEKTKVNFMNSHCSNHILTTWLNLIINHEFSTDESISKRIDDEKLIKELELLFEDFDDIRGHKDFEKSHIKDYHKRYIENFAQGTEKRNYNLQELTEKITELYQKTDTLLVDGNYKSAYKYAKELFYYDNSSYDKYMYLLLSKIKAKGTYEAYDAIYKLRKKDRTSLLNSVIFQKIFESEKYNEFADDIILHCFNKKKNKSSRLKLKLRGEDNDL